jgi:glycosyltransferase involved in cell wall biosynthesis
MSSKVSIITINLNNRKGLKKTIQSVLAQTYANIEYIIIDGASSDASIEEILAVKDHLAFWISEPDEGLYSAMNKGLKAATGEYVLFLNSADCFYDEFVIERVMNNAANEEVIYGNLCILIKGKLRELKSAPVIEYHQKYQHNLPQHPVIFFKRNLINQLGGFDERYKIIADVVLISRLFSYAGRSYKFVDLPVTVFDTNGISSNQKNQGKIYNERCRFIKEEFPQYLNDLEKVYKKGNILTSAKEKIKNFISNI